MQPLELRYIYMGFQIAAALIALVQVRFDRRRIVWLPVAAAILLIPVQSLSVLLADMVSTLLHVPIMPESVALLFSFLLFAGVLFVGKDIHDLQVVKALKRKSEVALKESEKRFRDVAECSLSWIWEVDIEGRYTYTSPVVEKVLGYKPGEVLERHFYDFFRPDEREQLKREAFDVFSRKHPFREFVNRNVHKSGDIVWLLTSGTPVLDEDGDLKGYRGVDQDITERKQAEEKLKAYSEDLERMVEERTKELDKARTRLFHSAKLAAVGRMGAGIAHQLNSPISSGLLFVDALSQDYKNAAGQSRILENLRNALMGMKEVIECTLSMSMVKRRGTPVRAFVDLNAVLGRVLDMVEMECTKRKVRVERLFDPGLPAVEAAVGELDQVFINLINNAVDAMEDGGVLSVRSERCPDGLEVHIRDSGRGIGPSEMDQIFEPFFTTRIAERGIGLGLAIAREIVEGYGGRITVESRPGEGSTFSIHLPVGGQDPSFHC